MYICDELVLTVSLSGVMLLNFEFFNIDFKNKNKI